MLNNNIHTAISLLSATSLAMLLMYSCSDKDNFTPGDEPTHGDVTAYFASNYKSPYIYAKQPVDVNDSLAVVRSTKNGVLSIPIIFHGDTTIHIQQTAEFEDGQDTTYIRFSAPNAQYAVEHSFSVEIPAEFADPYKTKDGTTVLNSAILYSSWDVVGDTVLFYSGNNEFPTQGCKLENLHGQNRFRFTNFLNSGNPLEFYIKCDGNFNSNDLKKNVGELVPLSNYYYNTKGWWYFTNPGTDGSWYNYITPAGKKKDGTPADTIDLISFWPGRAYTNIDLRLENEPAKDTIVYKSRNLRKIYNCDYSNAKAHYGTMCAWVDYKDPSISSNYVYFYFAIGYFLKEEKIENQ